MVAWWLDRSEASIRQGLYLGTIVLLVAGALFWGWQLADLNSFHVFFAGIAIFATPVAAVAVWSIWLRLRATGHARAAVVLLVLCGLQIEFGVQHRRGPVGQLRPRQVPAGPRGDPGGDQEPSTRSEARVRLPTVRGGWVLVSVGRRAPSAHWSRCRTDVLRGGDIPEVHRGRDLSDVPSQFFQGAPQRVLYPTSSAVPATNVSRGS